MTTPTLKILILLQKMAVCSKATLFAVTLILVALVYQRYRSTGNGESEQASVHRRKEGKKRILIG